MLTLESRFLSDNVRSTSIIQKMGKNGLQTKNILIISITGFGLSSLLCGMSSSLIQLVAFRFLQGVFGALMTPVGRLLMLKAFSKADLVKVFMLISMPLLLGPLLAPSIGGVLISYLI